MDFVMEILTQELFCFEIFLWIQIALKKSKWVKSFPNRYKIHVVGQKLTLIVNILLEQKKYFINKATIMQTFFLK